MTSPVRSLVRMRSFIGAMTIAVVLAACGGDRLSRQEYQQELNATGSRFSGTLEEIFSAPELQNPSSLQEAADKIREGADVFEQAVDELDALAPPEDAEAAHDRLVSGFRQLIEGLRGFADSAEEGNLDEIQAFTELANSGELPGQTEIEAAIAELEAKGYSLDQ